MAARKPSMADVARRAGVSPATVCNVLGSRKPVDRELAGQVRAAVAELGYEVDTRRIATAQRQGAHHQPAGAEPGEPVFTSFIAAIERCVRDEGYDIVVASSGDDEATERARLSALLSWRPAGIVVIPCTDAFAARGQLDALGNPYVIADRAVEGQNADTVGVDDEHAAAMAARHLLDLGHRDVLVVASSLTLANIRERCAGVGRAFGDAGLPQPRLVEVGLTFDSVADRLTEWLAGHARPTAMIALTNFASLGCVGGLRAHRHPGARAGVAGRLRRLCVDERGGAVAHGGAPAGRTGRLRGVEPAAKPHCWRRLAAGASALGLRTQGSPFDRPKIRQGLCP